MRYNPIAVGQKIALGARSITAVSAEHTVPAVGYHLDSGAGSLVFTGDTTVNDQLWPILNRIANLRYLIIEVAFANSDEAMAHISKHLCPRLLGEELAKLTVSAEIYVTHLKPGQAESITDELGQLVGEHVPRILQNEQVLEF